MQKHAKYWIVIITSLYMSACGVSESIAETDNLVDEFHQLLSNRQIDVLYDTMIHSQTKNREHKKKTINFFRRYSPSIINTKNREQASWNTYSGTSGRKVTIIYKGLLDGNQVIERFEFRSEDEVLKLWSYNFKVADKRALKVEETI